MSATSVDPAHVFRALLAAVGASVPTEAGGVDLGAEDADFVAGCEIYSGWLHQYPDFIRAYDRDGAEVTRAYAAGDVPRSDAPASRSVGGAADGRYTWYVERLDGTEVGGIVPTAREAFAAALAARI